MRGPAGASVLLLALGLAGCRDATESFAVDDRPELPASGAVRLTFSAYDDRSPTWSPGSDSIHYAARSADLAPAAPSTVLSIPREGGIASLTLTNVQSAGTAGLHLIAPARARHGDRIAFVQLGPMRADLPCAAAEVLMCSWPLQDARSVPLRDARVRVRGLEDSGDPTLDPAVVMTFEGPQLDTADVVPGYPTWVTRFHPFQYDYVRQRDLPLQPSWAPDGRRLAMSDGRQVLVWDVETGTTTVVPGTADGMAPAWSGDGEWIAFTFVERVDSIIDTCVLGDSPAPGEIVVQCYERRVLYRTAPPRVVLIRPDGSDRTVVAEGRDPAWDPHGRLYYSDPYDDPDAPIRRRDLSSGAVEAIPHTAGGLESSISPDGRWIAFSRGTSRTRPRDIWVAPLP